MQIEDITLIKPIGKGSFGQVFLTTKRGSQQQFATKKIQKSVALQEKVKKYFNNEIFILRNVNHPNIIKLYEIKQTLNNFYLVFENCNGGCLSTCLEKYKKNNDNKPFTQEIAQHIIKQIVSGVQYLHNNKILHRDLKLDNILVQFENKEENLLKCKIKIIDFGFARYLNDETLAQSLLGSPINMSPQILMKMRKIDHNQSFGYDQKADIWSLGTICYELLIGFPPFDAKNYDELTSKIQKGDYKIPNNLQLSNEAISFLNTMLQYDPKERLDIDDIAVHKFLTLKPNEFTPLNLKKIEQRFSNNDLTLNTKNITQSIISIFEPEKGSIEIPIPSCDIGERKKIESSPIKLKGDPNTLESMIQNKNINPHVDNVLQNEIIENGGTKKNNVENDLLNLLQNSFNEMNKDFYYIEPMLIPVSPNTDPKVLQLDI